MNEQIQVVTTSTGSTLWSALVIIALLVGAWFLGEFLEDRLKNIERLDKTLRRFAGAVAKYSIYVIAIVMVLTKVGVPTASLLAVLGAAGLAIGLALQGSLANFAGGVLILLLRPFKVGDWISAQGVDGSVKEISILGVECQLQLILPSLFSIRI